MNKKYITIILAIIAFTIGAMGYDLIINKNKMLDTENQNQQQTKNNYEIKGMKVEILKEGSGEESKSGDEVSVHYTGTLLNGEQFDSSIDRGQPFSFILEAKKVIQGWDLGVLGMKVGEKRKLTIPPELGYGEASIENIIPANSTLIFEVELISINK